MRLKSLEGRAIRGQRCRTTRNYTEFERTGRVNYGGVSWIIYDPSGDFAIGARFTEYDVRTGLRDRVWPNNMIILNTRSRKILRVDSELKHALRLTGIVMMPGGDVNQIIADARKCRGIGLYMSAANVTVHNGKPIMKKCDVCGMGTPHSRNGGIHICGLCVVVREVYGL